MTRLQKGANEEKQEKGVMHKEMLRLIKGEESEDAGLRKYIYPKSSGPLAQKAGSSSKPYPNWVQ